MIGVCGSCCDWSRRVTLGYDVTGTGGWHTREATDPRRMAVNRILSSVFKLSLFSPSLWKLLAGHVRFGKCRVEMVAAYAALLPMLRWCCRRKCNQIKSMEWKMQAVPLKMEMKRFQEIWIKNCSRRTQRDGKIEWNCNEINTVI